MNVYVRQSSGTYNKNDSLFIFGKRLNTGFKFMLQILDVLAVNILMDEIAV